MAPTRKFKGVSRRISSINEVSPVKDSGKSQQRKRKLSSKLGPQWDKEEIERFYQAYRKYGKDWKKVAASVRNRSVEMAEALYNMNRAYLSLPEGTASVVGLIAMMTDHYNNEVSGSEEESSDALVVSQKSLKRKRGKYQPSNVNKDASRPQSIDSNDGCLSLLKRRIDGVPPCAVRKRTPRVPVGYLNKKDDREIFISPTRKGRRLEVDANHDEGAHVAALALTEGLQRVGSPQVSHSPYRGTEQSQSSPNLSLGRMNIESKAARGKLRDASAEEDWLEGSVGSKRGESVEYTRENTSSLVDMEGVGTVDIQKGRKSYRKKEKLDDGRNSQFDDGGEACSGTEGGLIASTLKKKVEVSNEKEKSSPHGQRRRSKKLLFEDESSAFDALQTLADVSLTTNIDAESTVQLKEESKMFDMDDKSSVAEATSSCIQRDRVKNLMKEKPMNAGVEGSGSRKSKLGKDQAFDVNAASEVKGPTQPANKTVKRKRNSLASKITDPEAHVDFQKSKPFEIEAVAQEQHIFAIKGKRSAQVSASKQWRSIRISGYSNSDMKGNITDSITPTSQVPMASRSSLSTKPVSKRKANLRKPLNRKEVNSSEHASKCHPNKHLALLQDNSTHLKEKLSTSLSSPLLRRWCTYEWFYSAIDYPWFAKREFLEYLNHVGLGHIPRLTRFEWGVIRSSLGRPRRFSERFLHDEREKLNQYRESVRKHYTELRIGIREGVPADLARPLSVGQRVVALHPKTREVHDGSVLTVDQDKFRVQFDNPEFGVEFVMDVDCMPSNPLENMPEAIRNQKSVVDKFPVAPKDRQIIGHLNYGGPITGASNRHMDAAYNPLDSLLNHGKEDACNAINPARRAGVDTSSVKQAAYGLPSSAPYIQAREADIRAVSELTCALEKKNALLGFLRNNNNDLLEKQWDDDGSQKDIELYKKHYAMVLVQLKEANEQVSSALVQLRQRNTFPGNSQPSWPKPQVTSNVHGALPSSIDNCFPAHDAGSAVDEIVEVSRSKARIMVDVAIEAMSSMKEGDNVFVRIGEILNSIDDPQSTLRSPEQSNVNLRQGSQPSMCASESMLNGHAPDQRLHKLQIPSGLITSCVATLLMIQACTERQYPPADVAQIIDRAVSSLHPTSPQNLQIYREIQMSMGRLKTQILALVPT